MSSSRPLALLASAAGLVVLASCVQSDTTTPDLEIPSSAPNLAILDATNGSYSQSAYFLPPLAKGSPTITDDFNPNLFPGMRVCEITQAEIGDPSITCEGRTLIVDLPGGSFTVDQVAEMYVFSWDTDGPASVGTILPETFQRLEITLANATVAGIDLHVTDGGPGQSTVDAYAYQLGELIPVKVFLGNQVLCDPDVPWVTECITFTTFTDAGVKEVLDQEGIRLVVEIFENTPVFPSDWPFPYGFIRAQRVSQAAYFQQFGEECVVSDLPLVGDDCFQIDTYPEGISFSGPGSLLSMCLTSADFAAAGLDPAEVKELTMLSTPPLTALGDVAGDCPTLTASLLDVPESGLLRYAAMGVNAVADVVLPTPVVARDLNFGALKSNYSTHAFVQGPVQISVTGGDGTVIQPGGSNSVQVTFNASDRAGNPVEDVGMTVSTNDGTVNGVGPQVDVTTNALGNSTVTWYPDISSAGIKTLTATVLGGSSNPVRDHTETYLLTPGTVTANATVCLGDSDGTATIDGIFDPAEWACAGSHSFIASVSGGGTPASMHWMNDGTNLYMAVRLKQEKVANNIRIDFDNDGDLAAAVNDNIIGVIDGQFIDEYLTQKCFDTARSGCGGTDAIVNGSGKVLNDGTWTTWEVSQELAGDGSVQDFNLSPAGDEVGVFLSILKSRTAQGATYEPGFRQYTIIDIGGGS